MHAPGEADPNLYAYVRGMTLKAVDPVGLCEDLDACFQGDFRTSKVSQEVGDTRDSSTKTPPRASPTPPPAATRRNSSSVRQPGAVPWQKKVSKDAVAAGYSFAAALGSIGGYVVGRLSGESDAEAVRTANVTAGAVAQVSVPAGGLVVSGALTGAQRQSFAARNQSVAPRDAASTSTAPLPGELEGIASGLHNSAAKAAGVNPGMARKSGTVAITQLDRPGLPPRIATYHGDPRIGVLVEKYARAQGYTWGGSTSEHAEMIAKHFRGAASAPRGWVGASNKICYDCQMDLLGPVGPSLFSQNPKK